MQNASFVESVFNVPLCLRTLHIVTVLILFISVGRGKILAFTLVYAFFLNYLVYVVVLYSTAFGCCDKISVYY